ncbi:MAG: hypothetical protein ABMA01_08665 [Chthoniobacteraceae bacterium]
MNRTFFTLLASLLMLALSACSNFDSRFARGVPTGGPDDRFSGTYAGHWASSSHPGGGGKLWCILQKQKDATYLAEFRATWHGVFASEHSIVLHPKRARAGAGSRTFQGTAALDTFIGSGTYRCEGTMDGKRMRACYDATYARGTFDLQRVAPSSR